MNRLIDVHVQTLPPKAARTPVSPMPSPCASSAPPSATRSSPQWCDHLLLCTLPWRHPLPVPSNPQSRSSLHSTGRIQGRQPVPDGLPPRPSCLTQLKCVHSSRTTRCSRATSPASRSTSPRRMPSLPRVNPPLLSEDTAAELCRSFRAYDHICTISNCHASCAAWPRLRGRRVRAGVGCSGDRACHLHCGCHPLDQRRRGAAGASGSP